MKKNDVSFFLLAGFLTFCVVSLFLCGCNDEKVARQSFPCTLTQKSDGVLIECNDGTSGFVANGSAGSDGSQGPQGPKGDTGPQGPQGDPGYTPELFQLCPNDAAAFPEQGIRIGTVVYAVYWDVNIGAFLSRLIPGTYRTTNGSNCYFKVNLDGSTETL